MFKGIEGTLFKQLRLSIWCIPGRHILKNTSTNYRRNTYTNRSTFEGLACSCVNSTSNIMNKSSDLHDDIPTHKLRKFTSIQLDQTPVILLACGSFNPPHHVHLKMFDCAKEALESTKEYSVLGGYMSPVSDAYGKKGLISAKHRIEMCELATQASDYIMVDKWEAGRPSWTPTLDVLKSLENRLCKQLDIQQLKIMILCGSDLVESFQVPNLWSDEDLQTIIFKQGMICIARAGSSIEECLQLIPKFQNINSKQLVCVVENDFMNDLSSTKIREALKSSMKLEDYTSKSVVDYILKNGLYK